MFDYHQKTLDNGLRVVFVPMDTTSIVVNLYVGAGGKYEKENEHGLAHFFEHMAFKGTEKRPGAIAIAKQLDKIGAVYDAGTSKDYISYWIKNTEEHLDLMFDVLSDIVFNSQFSQADIGVERGVILEEINMYEDTPSDKAYHKFMELALGDGSLGRIGLGTKKSVGKFTRKHFLNYRDRFYSPSNMVLAVAGKASKEKVFDLTGIWFSGYEQFSTETGQINWQSKDERVLVEKKKTEQTHLVLGRPIFGLKDDRRWPMAVLKTVLGTGMSSRLFSEIREKRGLAYYVYASTHYYQEAGLFGVGAGVRKDKVQEAVELIRKELVNIGKSITKEEFDDAKEGIRGRILLSLESTNNLAGWAASTWLREGKIRTVEETLKKIESVNLGQVKDLANELFQPEKLFLTAIGPHKNLKL